MQTSLRGITNKAKEQNKYRFRDLSRLLNEKLLNEAWTKLNKKSAPGVDKVSAKEFGENLKENIQNIG